MTENFLLNLHDSIKNKSKQLNSFVLDNGLKVVIFHDDSKPKVLLEVAYQVGASAETLQEKGLAHLVEHMIFKGTDKLSEGDIDAISRKYGANYNAFTTQDITSYYFETDNSSWSYFLDILADCMQNSRFEKQHLASEFRAVIQELNLFEDDFESKVMEKAMELAFPPSHPYHFPIIGFKENLANFSAQDLKKFYNKYYHPSKALLIVAGNVDVDLAKIKIKEAFNFVTEPLLDNYLPIPKLNQQQLSSLEFRMFEDVEQNKITFFWRVHGLSAQKEPLTEVFVELLGGGANSRLYKKLIDETMLARDMIMQFDLMHNAGIVFLIILPTDINCLDEIKKCITAELESICCDGFLENEIIRVKKALALSFIRSTENWQNIAHNLINEIFLSGEPEKVFDYLKLLHQIDNSQLSEFAQKYFNANFLNVVCLQEAVGDVKALVAEKKKNVREYEKIILENHFRTTELEKPRFVYQMPTPTTLFFETPQAASFEKSDLDVIFYETPNYPLTIFRLLFRNSFILSKSREGLLVDLMMQCIMEGSSKYTKYENLDFMEDCGAQFSLDSDGIALTTLENNFLPALERLLHIFLEPNFSDNSLEKQKDILIADIFERKEDPQKIGVKNFYKHFYPESEFDWSYEDAVNFIKDITVEDLIEAHKKYSHPNSFLIGFAGQFDKDKIDKVLESHFSNSTESEFDFAFPQAIPKPIFINVEMMRDQVTLLLLKPSEVTILDGDFLPLSILNIVLFYSLGSRVYQIRERRGAFYSLFGGFSLDASQFGSIDYICTILAASDVEQTKNEILQEIELVQKNGITEEEFLSAKQIYLGGLINLFVDTPTTLQMLLTMKQHNLSPNYYDEIQKRVETMSLTEINQVAQQRLKIDDFGVITVGNISLS